MLKDLNQDFQDLIKSLTAHRVEFMVVGAHALAFHGVARYTADLDLWIRRSAKNIENLRLALSDFGLNLSEAEAQQMLLERKFLRMGREPTRIEILNFLDGCTFDVAIERSSRETLGETFSGCPWPPEDYVLTKVASGRPKDTSDLVLLRAVLGSLPGDER